MLAQKDVSPSTTKVKNRKGLLEAPKSRTWLGLHAAAEPPPTVPRPCTSSSCENNVAAFKRFVHTCGLQLHLDLPAGRAFEMQICSATFHPCLAMYPVVQQANSIGAKWEFKWLQQVSERAEDKKRGRVSYRELPNCSDPAAPDSQKDVLK
eukprot:scaffold37510_cov21-Tisochrysis_lutea.AAC.1